MDKIELRKLSALVLAEHVEVTYGRPELDHLLQSSIRDRDFLPSTLHHKLLSLPWSDIFTTNYDTLLERASDQITEKSFMVVRGKEDLMLDMLKPFGIYAEHMGRLPAQLSGGELQRLALARVLLAEPKVIILDKPTSMLDSISQAQVTRMLMDIRKKADISYLFISHNKPLCEIVCDRILIIDNGKIRIGE